MYTDSTDADAFRQASEWLELTLGGVSLVTRGLPLRVSFDTLASLDEGRAKHATAISAAMEPLKALSDGPIKWEAGRGLSGFVRVPTAVFPERWSSAHEAAWRVLLLALEKFLWPLEGITDATEHENTFKQLLSGDRRKALAMPMDEIADWQERICRERAKLLLQAPEPKPTGADTSPPATSLDARALAIFIEDPSRKKRDIAKILGLKATQSLSPERCPKLDAAMRAYRAPDRRIRGSKDADGNLEAWKEE